ncbi:hypothetical protein [Bradyrhizobium sp.]
MTKRHAKPTAAALIERTYRHVLAFKRALLNQMAYLRLDIAAARREDRTELMEELAIIKRRAAEAADAQEHVRILAEHCERLLREKETLQRQLYAVKEMKQNPLQWLDEIVPPYTTIHSHEPGKPCTEYCRTFPAKAPV